MIDPISPVASNQVSIHQEKGHTFTRPINKTEDTISEELSCTPIERLLELLQRYSQCLSKHIFSAKQDEGAALLSYKEDTRRKQHCNNGSALLSLCGGVLGGALTAANLKPIGEFASQAAGMVSTVVRGEEVIIDGQRQVVLSGNLPAAKQQEEMCSRAKDTQANLIRTILEARANAMRV